MVGDRNLDKSASPGRRGFLQATLMAGLATGAAGLAGWMVSRDSHPVSEVVQIPTIETPTATAVQIAELPASADVVAVEQESVRMIAELNQTRMEADSLRSQLASSRDEIRALNDQLALAKTRLGVLDGLAGLYAQLDSLALDDLVAAGLGQVAELVDRLVAQLPFLRGGLTAGASALNQLEATLPVIHDGINWLTDAINGLADYLQVMEDSLAEATEPLQPMAQKLAAFFARILRWIPFGGGKQIARGLDDMGQVLRQIPELVRSVGPVLLDPLARWFALDGEQTTIKTTLVDPMRGNVLEPAGSLADGTQHLGEQVKGVSGQLRAKIDDRRQVRDQIAAYRKQHQLS